MSGMNFISDLKPNKSMWKISVRVIRLWKQYSATGGETIEMLFMDAKIYLLLEDKQPRRFRQENHRRRRESCWRRNESAPPPGLTMKHTMDSDLSIVLDELSEATVDRVCCNPLPRDLSLKSAPGRAHLISTNILSFLYFLRHRRCLAFLPFLLSHSSFPSPSQPLRVAVLLSGGVDSSVALRLLHAAGHSCTAFYLKIWFQRVCEQVDVPLEVVHLTDENTGKELFLTSLRSIVVGVHQIRIDMEYDYVASGHYAKVVHPPAGPSVLELSQDMVKDQTYFLSHLSQSQLKRLLFPLGCVKKKDIVPAREDCSKGASPGGTVKVSDSSSEEEEGDDEVEESPSPLLVGAGKSSEEQEEEGLVEKPSSPTPSEQEKPPEESREENQASARREPGEKQAHEDVVALRDCEAPQDPAVESSVVATGDVQDPSV
ncbi:hypothetical protein Bca4012_064730 [Brassica carinata]